MKLKKKLQKKIDTYKTELFEIVRYVIVGLLTIFVSLASYIFITIFF